MGLEVSTFISGLTASWPLAGDQKNQGDDHLRLIKSVLQSTFPVASKAFYFPSAELISATQALDATDMNNTQMVDTTGGNVAVTLPAGLGSGDKGWSIDIIKTSTDTNAIIVSPSSGTIGSKSGLTATIRVGIVCEPATFRWTGSAWICSKPGPMIGSTENFDGTPVPPGYLSDDGSAFSNTAFAELFAVLGSSTLRDKRGRAEIGVDSGSVNMSVAGFGTSPILGAVRTGGGVQTLGTGNLPPYTPAGSVSVTSTISNIDIGGTTDTYSGAPGANLRRDIAQGSVTSTGTLTGTAQGGTSVAFSISPPAIVVNKIKRAC